MTLDPVLTRIRGEDARTKIYEFVHPGEVVGIYSSPEAMRLVPIIQTTIEGYNSRRVAQVLNIGDIRSLPTLYRSALDFDKAFILYMAEGDSSFPISKAVHLAAEMRQRRSKGADSIGLSVLEWNPFEIILLDEALRRYPYP